MRIYQAGVVAAAGCGSLRAGLPVPAAGPARTIAHPTSGGPTLASNRSLARAEARWLLARAPVPPGAVRIAKTPGSLSMPPLGRPAVGTLIDKVGVWRLTRRSGRRSGGFALTLRAACRGTGRPATPALAASR
jgi:hypothetical protein